MDEKMAVAIARRAIQAEYLALICAPGADLEFEYLCYCDAIADLESGAYAPGGVVSAYLD